jgi:diguanylate cyclase
MKKILVIEDQDNVRENIISILRFESYEVDSAEDGFSGLEKAKVFLPDLVICDIMMPEMSGYEVLKELRKFPECVEIPFIFLSAKSTTHEIRYGMNIGADDYITKPFTTEDLLNSIETRLKRKEVISSVHEQKFKVGEVRPVQSFFQDNETGLPGEAGLEKRLKETMTFFPKLTLFLIKLENLSYYTIVTTSDERLELTRKIVAKLSSLCKDSQNLFRLDFNKYAIIAESIEVSEIIKYTNRVIELLSESISIHGLDFNIKVSIGVSTLQNLPKLQGENMDELVHQLIDNAKTALQCINEQDSTNSLLFTENLKEKLKSRIEIENSIHKVLENQEFVLYYQPKIDILSGKLFGLEALLRWNSKDRGIIMPLEFISFIEKNGMIKEIGNWVLETACQYCVYLNSLGYPISVAVNVSGLQIVQPDFLDNIKKIIATTQIDPKNLEIEITETYLMKNIQSSIVALSQIKELGVSISLDDFGTGYSSLAYLKNLPIDTIKIDKKFVDDIHTDQNDQIIVQTIVKMAQRLSMDIIAEGVETKEQLQCLAMLGVHKIQGYYFSKPIPAEELEELLRKKKSYQESYAE